MNQQFLLGFVAAFAAVISWGIQLPVAKDAFVAIDPPHLSLFRYVIAVTVLAAFLLWREGPRAFRYRGRGRWAIPLGLLGMCISPFGALIGMQLTSAEHAVVIGSLQPTIAALGVWALQGRRPAWFTQVCILFAFLGVLLVVTKGDPNFIKSSQQLWGDAIILIGSACWVVYTAGVGTLQGWSTWRVTVLTMLPGTLATLLVTQVMVATGHSEMPSLEAVKSVAGSLIYLSFIGVLASMLLWNFGAKRIGIVNSSLLINFMPVVTFSWRAAHGHAFERIEIIGATVVVGALIANNVFLRRAYLRQQAA